MHQRQRGILVLAIITTASLAAIVVTWYVTTIHLPHPDQANREQVLRWLVLRDLKLESNEIKISLVNRLEVELGKGIELADQASSLSDSQRARVVSNVGLLKQVWFTQRVNGYHVCEPVDRMAFLEKQIDTISRWTSIDASLGSTSASDGQGDEASFFSEIDNWVAEAESAQQERMWAALNDGVVCWLAKRDLSEQPMSVRRELALRIAAFLDSGERVDSTVEALPDEQQKLLVSNGELLLEAWMHDRAEVYFEISEDEREEFVDTQIDKFTKWEIVELFTNSSGQSQSRFAAQLRFIAMIQTWIDRAESDKRKQLHDLLKHVIARWGQRS